MPASAESPDDVATQARALAAERGAAVLAAALVVRLRADRRHALADGIAALLSAEEPIIDGGPINPHRPAGGM